MIWTPWGPIHFCIHEMMALMAVLPFVGGAFFWLRRKLKLHIKKEVESHHTCCHPNDKHEV